jgi:energy-converting hydrogenase B subunit D
MTAVQAVLLVVVAVAGTVVVAARDPVRQAVVAGVFGLALAALFFAFSAPDVALSMLVVSSIAVPLMVLLALARIRADARRRGAGREGEGGS